MKIPRSGYLVFEDNYFLAVDKPAGVLSVPSEKRGNPKQDGQSSLFNVLDLPEDSLFPVHRLDRDTSGVLLLAKSKEALEKMQNIFRERRIKKIYKALVLGITPKKGRINSPIKRRERSRTKFRVSNAVGAREALTEFETRETFRLEFGSFSLLQVRIFTGRTHQIRVHLSSIGFPVLLDFDYGRRQENEVFSRRTNLSRQFLHASNLEFEHPFSKEKIEITAKLSQDLSSALRLLRKPKIKT